MTPLRRFASRSSLERVSATTTSLAMAHWQLGEKEQARQSYDKGVAWMDEKAPKDDELIRFRAEATELLGVETDTKSKAITEEAASSGGQVESKPQPPESPPSKSAEAPAAAAAKD